MLDENVVDDVIADDAVVEVHKNPEAEKTASRFGWKPQDEWTGEPDGWVDAETFLSRGKEYNGFLRKENDRLNSRLSEVERSMQEFAEHHKKVAENAYKQAVKDLKEARKEAIRTGDTEAQLELEEKLEELGTQPPVAETKAPEISAESRAAFQEWTQRNSWFGPNKEATEFANDIGSALMGKVTGVEFLKRVERAVRAEFPDLFTNPNRTKAGAVDTSAHGNTGSGKGKTYGDLPAEAKAACDKFVKNKWTTREQYVKEFFEEA